MKLPRSVQEIADVIGYHKALRLVRQLPPCGNRERRRNLYVPKPHNLKPNHKMVKLLGWDDAMALCQEHGGRTMQPAECSYLERAVMKDREILNWRDLGYEPREIAKKLDMSEKWVTAVLDADEMNRQGADIEVIAHSVKISPLTIGYILRIDIEPSADPVKPRGQRRPEKPQMPLEL